MEGNDVIMLKLWFYALSHYIEVHSDDDTNISNISN